MGTLDVYRKRQLETLSHHAGYRKSGSSRFGSHSAYGRKVNARAAGSREFTRISSIGNVPLNGTLSM